MAEEEQLTPVTAKEKARTIEASKDFQDRESYRARQTWGWSDPDKYAKYAEAEAAFRATLLLPHAILKPDDERLPAEYKGGIIPHYRALTLIMLAAAEPEALHKRQATLELHLLRSAIEHINRLAVATALQDRPPAIVKSLISNAADPRTQLRLLRQAVKASFPNG